MDTKERKFYTEREKLLLISLVDNYKNIIECKKTDAVSLRSKQEVWENICLRYNSNDVTKRTLKQLKKLWDNIKQKTRKSDSERKSEVLKTGGGPPPEDDNDPVREKVRSIVPTLNFEVENPWDSIAVFKQKQSEKLTYSDMTEESIRAGPSKLPLHDRCNLDNNTSPLSILYDHSYNMDLDLNNDIRLDLPGAPACLQDHSYEKDSREITMASNENKFFKAPTFRPTPKRTKRTVAKRLSYIEEETVLRKRKLEESILQQKELHTKKMEVAESEKRYWEAKTELLHLGVK